MIESLSHRVYACVCLRVCVCYRLRPWSQEWICTQVTVACIKRWFRISSFPREKQKDIGVICKTNRDAAEMSLRLINTFARLPRSLSKHMKKVCLCFKKENKRSLIISCETSWFNKPCQRLRHLALPSWWPPAENISQLMLRFPAAALAQMGGVLTVKWQKKRKRKLSDQSTADGNLLQWQQNRTSY